ncbi:glycosyltransferase family 2 protein [Candidatus Woesearchaeota archaeon]|nr:glycosyltransferase family 2 protein [Candidatus Woesearchaeota archaeon]
MPVKLSIIIPVYNEKNTILEVLKRVEKIKLKGIIKEIIIVDDCSTDGTKEILKKLKRHKVYFHEKNLGKGAALRKGFMHASGEIIITQDADLEYNPEDYPIILEPLMSNKSDIVYGSRFLGKHNPRYRLFYYGNKILSLFTSVIYGKKVTDMETGYKAFRRSILKGINIISNGFGFEPEFTAKVLNKGYKIIEVPVRYKCREFSEGKKISWKDGVMAIYYLIRFKK